jgi:hypothetical protein
MSGIHISIVITRYLVHEILIRWVRPPPSRGRSPDPLHRGLDCGVAK